MAQQGSWDPSEYERYSSAQTEWARRLIERLSLSPGDRLLDIGCADGKITAELAALAVRGRVVGVDSSADMVRFARQRFPRRSHPNLSFLVMDARTLSFRQEFTVVFSNAVLHWVADQPSVLAGICEALVPDGHCLLQMGGRGNAAEVLAAVSTVIQDPRWRDAFAGFSSPYSFHDAGEYSVWLAAAGLEPRRVVLFAVDMEQESRAAFAGWFRTTWFPYIERVPLDLREAFVEAAVEEYLLRHPLDTDGKVHVAMVRLEVEAARPAGTRLD
jgi:trans-aconitate 2-methyltransferase